LAAGWPGGDPQETHRFPDTVATDADLAAEDFPPDVVAALRDPSAVVELDIVPLAVRRTCAARSSGRSGDDNKSAAELPRRTSWSRGQEALERYGGTRRS